MNNMRLRVLAALALPACASAPAAPISSVAVDPGPASVVAPDAPYHPPYAMLFHEGNSWRLPVHAVKLAMIERGHTQGDVTCTVEHVDQYCDRRISNVTCEGDGAKLLAGQYSASWDGLWKAESADSSTELEPEAMLIARLPPFQQTTEQVATKPWGAAWCVTEPGETLCIQPGRGIIGAIDADYVVGEVPRKL